jgi:ABC-2 type transport system ATP-binding protein
VLRTAGIGSIADRKVGKCSGGEQQRLRFAMALLPDPALLLLDEPTTGMDVEGRRAFWSAIRADAEKGRTVLFATHYLEEADAYADRAILMAHGRIVADGPTNEIRARVGMRTIRATFAEADERHLAELPGVTSAERHGAAVTLRCADSDAAIRALLQRYPDAHDIEISSAGLEEAFLELTSGADDDVEGASAQAA